MKNLSHPRLAVGAALSLCAFSVSWAQSLQKPGQTLQGAVVTNLSPLIYPALARQTGTTGNVVLELRIQPNGSVASATLISGHPLLSAAALENAQHSQFVCNDCGEEMHSYRFVYTFELASTDKGSEKDKLTSIDPQHPSLRITQSVGQVVVADAPFSTVDMGPDVRKVRSVKCLYLWKCGGPH
jgi:TonB family protein